MVRRARKWERWERSGSDWNMLFLRTTATTLPMLRSDRGGLKPYGQECIRTSLSLSACF